MKDNNIRVAIQKKGRLREPSMNFLKSLGLKFAKNGNKLILPCQNAKVELLFVRNSDIPEYIKGGVADFGIVGQNVLFEKQYKLKTAKKLGFGKCSLVIAAPKGVFDLEGERIATSYPNSLKSFLRKKSINASVIEIQGSVEITPALNLADAICDITQTGTTLEGNNLRIIEKVLDSEAVLVQSPLITEGKLKYFKKLIR
ncbi:MAG: ATP phosphoribosyltransferase [Patescibacteria group bacterium]|nr:ATP phosphoribosyltransferase [Patescibacteria group bacterium]